MEASDKLVTFDTVVMSRYARGELPNILRNWIKNGLSTHAFLPLEGRLVFWVDPFRCKGQMAGKDWNHRALEILAETNDSQALNTAQILVLKELRDFANAHNEQIIHLLSYGEARPAETEGTITNIAFVREQLKLSDANKIRDQTPLPVVKADEEKAEAKGKIGDQEKTGSKCSIQ